MGEDSVLNIGGTLILAEGTEEIVSITSKEVDYHTKLHNFKLEGNNTYIANGYVVHNK